MKTFAIAIAALAVPFAAISHSGFFTGGPDLVESGNKWALVMEDFCSAQVVDAKRELIATAGHCATQTKAVFWKQYFDENGVEDLSKKVRYEADRVVLDEEHDLAIYKLSYGDLEYAVTLSDTPVKYQDTVYHIGNPAITFPTSELQVRTISEGKVVKPVAKFKVDQMKINMDVMRVELYMDGGSSGGALLNEAGEMVGMTNFVFPGKFNKIGAAVPVKYLIKLLKDYNDANE